MRILTDKEVNLVKLCVQEGVVEIQNKLWIDFKVAHSDLTVHQQHRLIQIEGLLYTLFEEAVEDYGVLQSQCEV
jgi:hypothetical protein